MKEKGLYYVGSGVSGGEEGARYGPSLMPGGAPEAWPHIKDIFQAIAAKSDNEPCCDWVIMTLKKYVLYTLVLIIIMLYIYQHFLSLVHVFKLTSHFLGWRRRCRTFC